MTDSKDPSTILTKTSADADRSQTLDKLEVIDRRRMLTLAGRATGLVVVGGALGGCGGGGGGNSPPTQPVALGNVSALSVGTLRVTGSVAVGRDGGGVYAMSAVCTHQGCIVGAATGGTVAAGLACPCHGSTYDGNGVVTNGPAVTALQHYTVTISTSGEMTADPSLPVSATARTAVA